MSTASPLPLQPLPPSKISQAEAHALKQEVSSLLLEHRRRRPRAAEAQAALPMDGLPTGPKRRVADSVAARFAQSVSYRDFLQAEAEAAIGKAKATAEVARRNAQAVVATQQQLLDEIQQWNCTDHAPPAQPTVLAGPAVQDPVPAPAAVAAPLLSLSEALQLQEDAAEAAVPIPANLIEFPRQLVAARRARPRLAEGPLRDHADSTPERAQLRIFEVEASAVCTEPAVPTGVLPEWHTIRLDAGEPSRVIERPDAQVSLAMPVYAARLSTRIMAAAVDGCCIVSAFLLAVGVAAYAAGELPQGLFAAGAAAGTLLLFSALYFLLFFSLNEATPGMRYARVGLCTFGDDNPSRSSMRRRLFAVVLAGLPLGLGWIWAAMDEDGLGWHDRISRMYPREY